MSKRIIALFPGLTEEPITAWRPSPGGVGRGGFRCRTDPTPGVLEGVAEDNAVPFHGNVFRAQPRNVRHELARGLVHEVTRGRVVAEVARLGARRAAAFLRMRLRCGQI